MKQSQLYPEDPAGAGRRPEIISNNFTHFGTYATSLKIPDVRNIQPDAGAVIGYFTYHFDGNCCIDVKGRMIEMCINRTGIFAVRIADEE